MPVDRLLRINDRIRRVLASAVYRMDSSGDIDTARLSFISVSTSHDLRNATVLVSFLGDRADHPRMLAWVRDHRVEFQRAIADELQLKYTPRLAFKETNAIAEGDRVLDILSRLPEPAAPDADPSVPNA